MNTTLRVLIFCGMVTVIQVEGHAKECLRCKKIEAERALEQASNPQEVKYYDDYLSMIEDDKTKSKTKRPQEEKVEKSDTYSEHSKN